MTDDLAKRNLLARRQELLDLKFSSSMSEKDEAELNDVRTKLDEIETTERFIAMAARITALEDENAKLKKAVDIAEGCERNAGKLAKLLNDDMVKLRDENARLRKALEDATEKPGA